MSSDLYEVLDLNKSASPDDIRKAYKRKALSTHPDRLPPTATDADRTRANEQFRLVNNAYEVLINAENRKLYDQYGVWPPPAPEPEPTYQNTNSYSRSQDSFGADPFFGRAHRPFAFTDPFELFNSLFGDFHSQFANDPFFANAFPSSRASFGRSPFGASPFGTSPFGASPFGGASPFSDPFFDRPFGGSLFGPSLFGGPLLTDGGMGSSRNTRSYSSSTQAIGMGGQWVSESHMTRTVNGRTETIIKKRDTQGNEHVTYLSPDGERYTINGVEQPTIQDKTTKPPPAPPAISPPQAPPVNSTVAPNYSTVPPPVVPPRLSKESHRLRTSSGDRHDYADQAHRYDSSGNRRSSSSRRRHTEYAETRPQAPPQPYPQPQNYTQKPTYAPPQQAYAQPQAYVQSQVYASPQTYPPTQTYTSAPPPPQPQYTTRPGSGTRADPIYIDDRSPPPVVQSTHPANPYPTASPYPHAGEKRHRGDSDGDRARKWWHGGHNGWFGGLLKHLNVFGHHHESESHEEQETHHESHHEHR